MGGVLTAIITTVLDGIILQSNQSYLAFEFQSVSESGYEFIYRSIGDDPISIGETRMHPGQFIAIAKQELTLQDIQKNGLSKHGSLGSNYSYGVSVFPGSKKKVNLKLQFDEPSMKLKASTLKIEYESIYDNHI